MPAIRAMEILWLMLGTRRSLPDPWLTGITGRVRTGERIAHHRICRRPQGNKSLHGFDVQQTSNKLLIWNRSTPSLKHKENFGSSGEKPGTPGSKPTTPNGQSNGKPPTPGAAYPPGFPRPGEIPPLGYAYQNGGGPPPMMGGFPLRPPLVS